MKQILCFGDSNTYGLIPGTKDRYDWDTRWSGRIGQRLWEDGCRIVEEDDHFALHGNTQDGKQLAPCDEEWVRSYAADKLLGIQMIDKGCANAEYIIRLRKE
jgi:hypothetical protein